MHLKVLHPGDTSDDLCNGFISIFLLRKNVYKISRIVKCLLTAVGHKYQSIQKLNTINCSRTIIAYNTGIFQKPRHVRGNLVLQLFLYLSIKINSTSLKNIFPNLLSSFST